MLKSQGALIASIIAVIFALCQSILTASLIFKREVPEFDNVLFIAAAIGSAVCIAAVLIMLYLGKDEKKKGVTYVVVLIVIGLAMQCLILGQVTGVLPAYIPAWQKAMPEPAAKQTTPNRAEAAPAATNIKTPESKTSKKSR